MGLTAFGYIATLYLSWLELKFMKIITKTDYDFAKKLSKVSRYLDDINTPNIKNFTYIAKQIYPPELTLDKTTDNDFKDSYLDLDIEVEDGQFKVGIYNKTDYFDFPVVSFPYPDSSMSSKVILNCFYS